MNPYVRNALLICFGALVGVLGLLVLDPRPPRAAEMNSGFALTEPIEGYLSVRCAGWSSDRVVAVGYAGPDHPRFLVEVDQGKEWPHLVDFSDQTSFCTVFRSATPTKGLF